MRYELRRGNLLLIGLSIVAGFAIAFLVRQTWRDINLLLGIVLAISVAVVIVIDELVFRLSHYLILHEGYLDLSEGSWGIPLGRTKQTIDYASIAAVGIDEAQRTVTITRHPVRSPGRYARYTNSIKFKPRNPRAVVDELRQRVRRAQSAEFEGVQPPQEEA